MVLSFSYSHFLPTFSPEVCLSYVHRVNMFTIEPITPTLRICLGMFWCLYFKPILHLIFVQLFQMTSPVSMTYFLYYSVKAGDSKSRCSNRVTSLKQVCAMMVDNVSVPVMLTCVSFLLLPRGSLVISTSLKPPPLPIYKDHRQ